MAGAAAARRLPAALGLKVTSPLDVAGSDGLLDPAGSDPGMDQPVAIDSAMEGKELYG